MAPIGVAIVGSGIFVKEQHLPAVAQASDLLSLKAIYSRSLKSAQETAALATNGASLELYSNDAGVGRTYHDLLLRDDVHAVIIALPILSQPEHIEAALKAGKHVLAEKPIAADVAGGKKLIDYWKSLPGKATLSIAENHRFLPSFTYAAEQAARLGRVTHFDIKSFGLMRSDNKYFNTAWRKTPEYQGGFLLDGGVHHAATARLFLRGKDSAASQVAAYSQQAQEHLPPIDSVTAIVKTKSGASGAFQISSGTRLSAYEWQIGYEKGSVKVAGEKVTVTTENGEETVKEFERTSGVKEEVAAWAQGIASGKQNPLQTPEEALADLEFLEKMFRSGEQDGAMQKYELQ
ncbi:oxidoreductase family protein [Emericellopsis atlantica]|uniref:Oxidoreductase family protein n=1 Tax=Emericellopsis atlantica TaxID=2614577 RepID=A0A9P7ZPN3_9HYPO|nr:oxidoreductase family protein [Emericellopsis atlantica]KAG9255512.1 oxidoreductase family protein [Emericellopsis atlantica]